MEVKREMTSDFVHIIGDTSPWFLARAAGRGLNVPNWEQVKLDLQRELQKQGPEHLPMAMFSLWRLVKEALLMEKVKV